MFNNQQVHQSNQQGGGQTGVGNPGGPLGLIGLVAKGVAAGIGLASESIHAHKEKKNAKKKAAADQARRSQSQPPPSELEGSSPLPPYSDDTEKEHVMAAKQRAHLSENRTFAQVGGELEEGDEEQWELDDAQDELIEREPANPKKRPQTLDPKKITQYFIDDYPVPQGIERRGKLTLPVVLPQRRPKDRTRGFIRAYAPELMNAGIDQAMFLDFLETFNLATQASPWINAINMAGIALMPLHLAPGIGQAATVALYLTVQVMKNMQSRKRHVALLRIAVLLLIVSSHRYHTVMDQMNEQFFQPRGLYAMVLTWNPETDATNVGINLNETISKNLTPPEGISKVVYQYKPSMGNTNGVAFTETAPLVFPALDKLEDDHSKAAKTTKEKIKSAKNFSGEYFDRRAQAKYAAKNPDSQLVVGPQPTFTSRYSDPNNPTNSGDILALLTAGKVSMPAGFGRGFGGGVGGTMGGRGFGGMPYVRGMGRGGTRFPLSRLIAMSNGGIGRMMMEQQITTQKNPSQWGEDRQYSTQTGMNQQFRSQMTPMQVGNQGMMGGPQVGFGGADLIVNGVKRILRHHVLYLLIINMPSEKDMTEATAFMEQDTCHELAG
ncbi:hypothetical protein Asppvi_003490 [Aspergillus pseudoviridinutans]|uniref:Uncharacterized protein n=1 Tax=Aspergillus pseudoviridinutans TaxID=1517512 RepID=A0A9P3EQW3_9EURO|nr:uncharacterized protein Asppvi_003490 [Aspergillus pseudoviridinutans]GIJ84641.1 hypothetical protein Asppvi_003490 [Aspergillus pseudoviridinutans]